MPRRCHSERARVAGEWLCRSVGMTYALHTLPALLLLAPNVPAQPPAPGVEPIELRIDAGHSLAEFSIPFLYGRVKGRFDRIQGTLLVDTAAPRNSSVSAAIDARSISTGSAHRDEHLRSADFFDAARFPTITFRSRRIEPAARGGGFVATGELTIRGIAREIAIPFRPTHALVEDPHGSTIATFAGTLRLNRKDFGILGGSTFNPWFDQLRSATMGDSVDVTLEVQGWRYDYRRRRDAAVDSVVARIARDGVAAVAAGTRAQRAERPAAFANAEWNIDQVTRALQARGRDADALEIARMNVEFFPQSASAHAALGRAHHRLGQRDSAAASYARALALDPNETRAWEWQKRLGLRH